MATALIKNNTGQMLGVAGVVLQPGGSKRVDVTDPDHFAQVQHLAAEHKITAVFDADPQIEAAIDDAIEQQVPGIAEGIAEEAVQEGAVQQAMKSSNAVKLVHEHGSPITELVGLRKKTWTYLVLPYNVPKKFADRLTFNVATGLDQGELDLSTWYYYYAVSTGSLETDIALKASKIPPSQGGPCGCDVYKYLGANWCNEHCELEGFTQTGSRFKFVTTKFVEKLSDAALFTQLVPQAVPLRNLVPPTANETLFLALSQAMTGGEGIVKFFPVGGETSANPYAYVESFTPASTPLAFEMQTPGQPKMIYRQIEEYHGNLDEYKLLIQGYKDEYLLGL